MRSFVVLLAVGLGSLGLGAAGAKTGDVLYVRETGVALRSAPEEHAPVALHVSRSYRLTELDRRGEWIKVEPYNVRLVDTEAWVRDSLVGPRPVDAAPGPKPPRSDRDGATGRAAAGCDRLLRDGDSLSRALASGCLVVVVIDRRGFGLFNAAPRGMPRPPTRGRSFGNIVPPFSASPVPPFASSPVPSLVPSR